MKLRNFILIIALFSPGISFAFFCPNNFNQIDFGYTIDQVTQQCGKPNKEDKKQIEPQGPQEWNYYIQQRNAPQVNSTAEGALKTQMSFDSDGKLLSITVNGIGVQSTSLCGSPVQLGDDKKSVQAACGEPGNITKQESFANAVQGQSAQKTQVTEFTYSTNPPVTLIFENGILKDKK